MKNTTYCGDCSEYTKRAILQPITFHRAIVAQELSNQAIAEYRKVGAMPYRATLRCGHETTYIGVLRSGVSRLLGEGAVAAPPAGGPCPECHGDGYTEHEGSKGAYIRACESCPLGEEYEVHP